MAWPERRMNESVLQEIGKMRGGLSLLHRTTRQKMMLFGRVMRTNGLEKMALACGEGRRRRPWKRWMEETLVGTGMDLEELREVLNCGENTDYDSTNRRHKVTLFMCKTGVHNCDRLFSYIIIDMDVLLNKRMFSDCPRYPRDPVVPTDAIQNRTSSPG